MPITTFLPNPTLLAEQTILSYISSSLAGYGVIDVATNFYCGVANTDVEGPAVVVAVNSAQETYFQTRVFRINADISTRMIAADSYTSSNVTGSSISLGGEVFSLFNDDSLATRGLNSQSSSLAVYQTQVMDYRNERIEDAWISNLNVNLIAMVVSH